MRLGTIYTLTDPRTGLVRYVGQTICKIDRRLSQHIYQWKRSHGRITHVNSWIKNLAKENMVPVMDVVEDGIDISLLDGKEVAYIQLFKAVGALLCNHTAGGGGTRGTKWSEETRTKRQESLKNSVAWQEKCKEHSYKLKARHAQGVDRKDNVSYTLVNIETGEEHTFSNGAKAGQFLGLPYRKFAKKAASKSGEYLGFRINKNPKGSK